MGSLNFVIRSSKLIKYKQEFVGTSDLQPIDQKYRQSGGWSYGTGISCCLWVMSEFSCAKGYSNENCVTGKEEHCMDFQAVV